MNKFQHYPTLYKKTSTGAIQEWTISAESFNQTQGAIKTVWGQMGGKKQTAIDYVDSGKNIGRANETTAYEQAVSEAQSQWEKKKKNKNYVESIEDAQAGVVDALVTGGADVMLAQSFAKHGAKIIYPCYAQRKFDGHRCVAVGVDGKFSLWSRTRKEILGVPHIARQLEMMYPGETRIFDGELYNHDYKDRFEELTSFIRQEIPKPGHEVVEYHIYDEINDMTFHDRHWNLRQLSVFNVDQILNCDQIVFVQTELVHDEDGLMFWFDRWTKEGYEGVMARNKDSKYVGKRSYDLQKIKEFDDSEFLVIDVEAGRGKMADKGVFVCRTSSGETFKAKMVGDLENLVEYLDNKEDYIGKMLTVKYQGLTGKNGVPRFPVAMRLRDDV